MKQRLVEVEPEAPAPPSRRASRPWSASTPTPRPSPRRCRPATARILTVDAAVERGQIERLKAWRDARDGAAVKKALAELAAAAKEDRNIMPASIACAQAGVTTGEWTETLRAVFGEYRAPDRRRARRRRQRRPPEAARREVETVSRRLGRRIKILVGKPGPRRPFQRRRADRRARPRLRHGGGLRGHPPDARAHRQRRARGERARRRPLDPVGRPCLAGRARCWTACARPASATCRSWSAASSRRPTPRR